MKGSDKIIHMKQDEIAAKVNQSDGPSEQSRMWYSLQQGSVTVLPDQCAEFCSVVEKVCRYADTKTFGSVNAASDLTLIVEVADKALYDLLEFSVGQAHRQPLERSKLSDVASSMTYEWHLKYPILPSQGIILHWRPKPPNTPSKSVQNGPPASPVKQSEAHIA